MERLTSTYSVGVMHLGSSCGQPGEENSKIAANKWFMRMPPGAALDTKLSSVEKEWNCHPKLGRRGKKLCMEQAALERSSPGPPDNRKE